MAGRPISIAILANASQAKREFGDVADSAEKSTGRLRSSIGKVGLLVAGGLALGLGAAAKAGIDFAQAAIEDEKAASRMAQTFTQAAGATKQQIAATEDWITAQGKALGVADDDLRPALSRLVTATKDVGEAQKLTKLAMDVSAGSGKSLEQVSTALMKAQNGQVAGLSRLGINTKNAAGDTISMAEATQRMADTFGGAAQKNADTLGGRMDRLKLMASEAGETIGAKMLPYIERFATFVTDKAVPAVTGFIDGMKSGVGVGGQVASVFGTVRSNLDTIVPVLGVVTGGLVAYKVATLASAAATAIQAAGTAGATGATWSLNAALRANPIGLVITALTLLGAGLVIAYKKSETFRDVVDGALSAVAKGFDALGRAGTWLWNNALQPAFKFIVNGVASILDLWSTMLAQLGKVPGFGWAKDAAAAMSNAADKAREMADGIKKIPPRKDITIHTAYTYSGLRNGGGTTRGRDDEYSPRAGYDAALNFGGGVASGLTAIAPKVAEAGKKLGEKAIKAVQGRLDDARELRTSILSLRDTLAGALTGDLFGGTGDEEGSALDKFRASLNAAKATAGQVADAVRKLIKAGVGSGFLNSLIGSGNTELIVQLAGAPDVKDLAGMYEAVIKENEDTGRLVAEQVIGTRLDSVNATIRDLTDRLDKRDEQNRNERRQPVRVELTYEQVHQLERGRKITADLKAFAAAGGTGVAIS